MQVGESVVLPGCGVGEVEARVEMNVEGEDVELFRITLENSTDTVWVPIDRVAEQGVRPVMAKDQIERVLKTVAEQTAPKRRRQWNQRQRRYTQLLMSNQPVMLAQLVGELSAVREGKALSFTEKRMYRQAWDLLLGELAASAGVSRAEMAERVTKEVEVEVPEMAA